MRFSCELSFRRNFKEFVVLDIHDSWIVIVSEVNSNLLSAADLLVAWYFHFPADHHLTSCLRRDLAFHFGHETLSGSPRWNVNLRRRFNIFLMLMKIFLPRLVSCER